MNFIITLIYITVFVLLNHACTQQTNRPTDVQRQPDIWSAPNNPLAENPEAAFDQEISAILSKLTLQQKIGQMVQAQMDAITPEEVRDYHIGSVLNGGNAYANNDKYASVEDWVALVDSYYRSSMDSSNGRVAIPIMWGTDAVHGHNKVVGATLFPHNIGLGASRNPTLVNNIARITAIEMLATGVDWNFAPSVAVVRDDRWGRTYESFSEDPELVAQLTKAYVLGLQGDPDTEGFMNENHVMATAKHFIGDGGTENGIDRGNNTDTEPDLLSTHAQGYLSAIEAGVLSIMPSHSMWHGERLHGHHYLLTEILKNRMGFDGFLIGDWNSHGLVKGCKASSCPQAVNAGLDMFMVTHEWKAFIENTTRQVERGVISESRIDDAVARILRAKFRAGLFHKAPPSERKYANQKNLLGSKKHRSVARQAVRESMVLLKNNNKLLPLDPSLNILVAGDGADNIGKQSGGWTISWSGAGAKNSDFPNGISILSAIKNVAEKAGGTVEFDIRGNYKTKPDVAIVVFGEEPYAEWFGDIKHLSYQRLKHTDASLLEKLKADGVPTLALLISGRPLWLNRAINASDAFVALWLPGTEASGVSDVIFTKANGDTNYDFVGKLPFSWPMYPSQTELNKGDKNYKPLFPFGYGLNYTSPQQVAKLTDNEDIPEHLKDPTLWIFNGQAEIPWFMCLQDDDGFSAYLGGIVERPGIRIQERDRNTQGDAVEVSWSGERESSLTVLNWEIEQDYLYYLQQKSALAFDLNLYESKAEKVELRLGMLSSETSLDITENLEQAINKGWKTLYIPLSCLQQNGLDLSRINVPFSLTADGPMKMELARIRLELNAEHKAAGQCKIE